MIDLLNIQKKWQKKWAESNLFEPEVDVNKPKFFATFPYPYINGIPHVGHLFTAMRVEAFARYKRHKGYNVLFPQAWHATGAPIVTAAKKIEEHEPGQWKIMLDMGIPEDEIESFADPKKWVDYFPVHWKKDFEALGMSIDWRREFYTTDLNPYYDKFIKWQFNRLKEKGYVIKGKFPVVWCPKCSNAVGDDSRKVGEGETPQEFSLFKFKLDNDRYVVTATLRPDTIKGITNIYVNPEIDYDVVQYNYEKWIVGTPIIAKLRMQDYDIKEICKISGKELIGQHANFDNRKIIILPATFLDPNYGTGMVHSVPSDSADDLIALKDLQKNDKLINEYGLDADEIKAIKPIEIFDTPEIGGNPAKYFLDKYNVKSQNDRDKLDKIKKELYTLTLAKSKFNHLYSDGFSKNLEGTLINEGQEIIKQDLLKQGKIHLFYELTGNVICRCLTECIVKVVSDQWFIDYSNEKWKEITRKCLKNIKLYPEKSRQQFEYVIGWLHEWACTREKGIGTKLPWDTKWLIDSLSDSTIYPAYYTITHLLTQIHLDGVDDNLFDYIFLHKDDANIKIDKEIANKMRKEFEYWYPCDFRNSGKDLLQNHLTFYMFNHTALFPEDKWPAGIGVNGHVTVDSQKMSKSLGNMILARTLANEFFADPSRLTMLSGGEGMDDANWDSELAKSLGAKFDQLFNFVTDNFNKGRDDILTVDIWMESKFNRLIQNITYDMEDTNFRSAIQKIFFELPRLSKTYLNKTQNHPNKKIMNQLIKAQIIMLCPFTPHLCEELWESIKQNGFVSVEQWPEVDESKINDAIEQSEGVVDETIRDVNQVLKLIKLDKARKIVLFVAKPWKYKLFSELKDIMQQTRNQGEIIKLIMQYDDLKQHGPVITKLIPKLLKDASKIPIVVLDQKTELKSLEESLPRLKEYFGCEIDIVKEQDSSEAKSSQAMPSKPSIIVE